MEIKDISQSLVKFAIKNKDHWNALDGAQGDGDLGITILLSAQALSKSSETYSTYREWFMYGGKEVRKAAPSTMGILLASALIAAGISIPENKQELTLIDWIMIQQVMADEIQNRGGAKIGDKTILDAFLPAIQTFKTKYDQGCTINEILLEVSSIAKSSAENTANLESKTGRSSWLGERSFGNIDGGAWVCYQIYEFFHRYLEDNSKN